MRTARINKRHLPSGMTLIELLVVMSIIVVVAGMAVWLFPKVQSEKGSRGAQDLQGSLMEAKYRSLRDKSPKGVRLIADPSNLSKIRSYQFIEQPDNWKSGTVRYDTATPGIYYFSADLTGGLGTGDPSIWPIQSGDFLYVNGTIRGRILTVNGITRQITVSGDAPVGNISATPDWFAVRRPRPIPGEEVINFPEGVVVDLGPYSAAGQVTTTITNVPLDGYYDILFTPSGALTGAAGNQGQVYLWVRDETRPPTDPGEQIVIVIWSRTGKIGAYPVDTTVGQHPLSFTQDPNFRPSGL